LLADATFKTLYERALTRLQTELYDSGSAQEILDKWSSLLKNQAADLVEPATVQSEADAIAAYFSRETEAKD
jgi:spore coat protein CotH